jgi:hypothetical protein
MTNDTAAPRWTDDKEPVRANNGGMNRPWSSVTRCLS